MIKFKNVTKEYNNIEALKNFSLEINEGEFFVLVGPSGSGKTTTLKMINRLIDPTSGEIFFKGKSLLTYDIRNLRLQMGYVLQEIALFPNLTVSENIELIPELKKWPKNKRKERAKELLFKVNLNPDKYMNRLPRELSGGEKQRIGILRALAAEPDIILMDEPLSALDPISREKLQILIKKLHKDFKKTIVFVTHDINEAMVLGDRICIMQKGSIVQIDSPKNIKMNPKNEFVEEFFKNDSDSLSHYTVKDIINLNLMKKDISKGNLKISPNYTLKEIIPLILDENTLLVEDKNIVIGSISEKDILKFIDLKVLKGGN